MARDLVENDDFVARCGLAGLGTRQGANGRSVVLDVDIFHSILACQGWATR